MKNKKIIISMLIFILSISLVACKEEVPQQDLSFMEVDSQEIRDLFSSPGVGFDFQETSLDNGLIQYQGQSGPDRGDANLVLYANQENKLARLNMEIVTVNDDKQNAFNSLYLLGAINSIAHFEEADSWLLSSMEELGQGRTDFVEKELEDKLVRLETSKQNNKLILSILPKN